MSPLLLLPSENSQFKITTKIHNSISNTLCCLQTSPRYVCTGSLVPSRLQPSRSCFFISKTPLFVRYHFFGCLIINRAAIFPPLSKSIYCEILAVDLLGWSSTQVQMKGNIIRDIIVSRHVRKIIRCYSKQYLVQSRSQQRRQIRNRGIRSKVF